MTCYSCAYIHFHNDVFMYVCVLGGSSSQNKPDCSVHAAHHSHQRPICQSLAHPTPRVLTKKNQSLNEYMLRAPNSSIILMRGAFLCIALSHFEAKFTVPIKTQRTTPRTPEPPRARTERRARPNSVCVVCLIFCRICVRRRFCLYNTRTHDDARA